MKLRWLALLASAPFVVAACGSGVSGTASDGASGNAGANAAVASTSDGGAPDASSVDSPNASAGTSAAPELTSLSPAKIAAGAHGVTVTLIGHGFTARTTVQVNGAVVASTFVDSSHLKIALPDDLLSTGGMVHVSTVTAPPGGGTSAQLTLEVDNPAPLLTRVAPLSTTVGQGNVQLTIAGGAFAPNAVVDLDGSPLATVVFSSGQLAATIPSGIVASPGTHTITVVNAMPGGGTSSSITFTVADASAALTGMTPDRAFAGSGAALVTLTGSAFSVGSVVLFNGTRLGATVTDSSDLTVTVPASLLMTAGDLPVSVVGPFATDQASVPLVFHVDFGAPIVDIFDPNVIAAGSGDTLVTIHGDGFAAGATVTFDGQMSTSTYVDRTELTAVLPRAIAATTHDVDVVVTTPAPAGGTSSTALLPVRGESPDAVAISPSTAFAGAGDTAITITGASFLPSSVVDFDGVAIATTYVNGTSIQATIPAADLATPGTHAVSVDNGDSGTSGGVSFSVSCDTSGTDAVLLSTGAATTFTIDWTNSALLASPVTPITTTGAGVCPSTAGTGVAQPAVAYVVMNGTGAPASLEAWAVCGVGSVKNDAFLTFYDRATVPATDADRLACTGAIAEGASGYGGLSSPEANATKYCPGLTLANSAALSLPACGRAVVLLQPWDVTSTTYPPPSTVRVDLR